MWKMQVFLKRKIRGIIGFAIGMVLGFLYFKFIGCASGTCKITSNPIYSTLYGGLLGYFLLEVIFDVFVRLRSKK